MAVRSIPRRRLGVVALVIVGLVLATVAPAGAARRPASLPRPEPRVTQTELPAGVQWSGINNRGQLVGTTTGAEARTVLWKDGEVTDVAPHDPAPDPFCPVPVACWVALSTRPGINDRGHVATYQDGQAVLLRNGTVTELGGGAESSWILDLNDRGQVLVLRFAAEQVTVGLWSRGTFTELHSGPTAWAGGRLSDRGHAVVTLIESGHEPPCLCPSGFLWHRGVRTDFGSFAGIGVNRRGQVIGSATDPATDRRYPALWEHGEVTPLPTLGGDQTGAVDINDRGQIVGYSTVPGSSQFHTVLWEDGEVVDIGAGTGTVSNDPVGIDARGRVLIRGNFDARQGALLWDDGEVVPLPSGDEPFRLVQLAGFNDRGQVFGRYSTPSGPYVPTLWEIR